MHEFLPRVELMIRAGGEIMIPLVVSDRELAVARQWVTEALDQSGHTQLAAKAISIGAMIETPRAGVDAVSCSPFRVPLSRLKMAQALLYSGRVRWARPTPCSCGEHAGHPDSVDFFIRAGVDAVSCSPFRVPLSRLAVAQALLDSGRVSADAVSFSFDDAAGSASSAGEPDGEASAAQAALEVDEDLVLYVLRVRGYITPDGLQESLGTVPTEIMDDIVNKGWVEFMEERNMYMLTPEGTEEQECRLEASADPALAKALAPAYQKFLELNEEFKELCNAWQLKDDAPNDHSDAAYDQRQIDALQSIAERVQAVIGELSNALPRLARYDHRLQNAARRVAAGEIKMFTGVMCGSFHDIWMELHEDLMLLQGIDRAEEGSF